VEASLATTPQPRRSGVKQNRVSQNVGNPGTDIYGNKVTPDLYFCKYKYPSTHIYWKNGCSLVNMRIPS